VTQENIWKENKPKFNKYVKTFGCGEGSGMGRFKHFNVLPNSTKWEGVGRLFLDS